MSTHPKVAEWRIEENVICGDSTVSFYAPDERTAGKMKNALLDFMEQMPHDITVTFF